MDMTNYPQIFRILSPYPEKELDEVFADAKKSAVHERTKKFIKEMELLKKEVDLLEERNGLELSGFILRLALLYRRTTV